MTWSNYNYHLLIYKFDSVFSSFVEGTTKLTSLLVSCTAFLLPPWSFVWPLLTVSVRIMYVCSCAEERIPLGSWFLFTLGSGCWIGLVRHGQPPWAFVLLISGLFMLLILSLLPVNFSSLCPWKELLSPFSYIQSYLRPLPGPLGLLQTLRPHLTCSILTVSTPAFLYWSSLSCLIPGLFFLLYTVISHACAFYHMPGLFTMCKSLPIALPLPLG